MVSEKNFKNYVKCCPIEAAFVHIGKKWAINIIRDLFMGKKRFKEFLEVNKNLSGKVLSQRLKELEKEGIIKKKIVSKTPLRAEYELTPKGRNLEKVLYEVIVYAMKNCSKEVFKKCPKMDEAMCSRIAKQSLRMK